MGISTPGEARDYTEIDFESEAQNPNFSFHIPESLEHPCSVRSENEGSKYTFYFGTMPNGEITRDEHGDWILRNSDNLRGKNLGRELNNAVCGMIDAYRKIINDKGGLRGAVGRMVDSFRKK